MSALPVRKEEEGKFSGFDDHRSLLCMRLTGMNHALTSPIDNR